MKSISNVKRDKHVYFTEGLVEWEDRKHESILHKAVHINRYSKNLNFINYSYQQQR